MDNFRDSEFLSNGTFGSRDKRNGKGNERGTTCKIKQYNKQEENYKLKLLNFRKKQRSNNNYFLQRYLLQALKYRKQYNFVCGIRTRGLFVIKSIMKVN